MFESIDKNKDGTLSFEEIKSVIDEKLSVHDSETLIRILKSKVDAD
jgi:Ca2+-binding EF-hand superfamily protein